MKTIQNILLATAAIFALTSCESDADVDIPETKPKLVVTSFISPQDTQVVVRVKRSKPIFQSYDVNTSASVANANVQITDGSTTMQLNYNSTDEYYGVSATLFPITTGTSYTLTVTTPEGETATAKTTVPGAAPASISLPYSYILEDSTSFQVVRRYTFNEQWADFSGQADLYRLIPIQLVKNASNPTDTFQMRVGESLITDDNNDGGTIQNNIETYMYFFQGGDTIVGYDFYLMRSSPEYYLYHESLFNYNSGDPFSEPSLIYTNITGGLGVFGSYQQLKKRVLL
jgi:hypothetical protein